MRPMAAPNSNSLASISPWLVLLAIFEIRNKNKAANLVKDESLRVFEPAKVDCQRAPRNRLIPKLKLHDQLKL